MSLNTQTAAYVDNSDYEIRPTQAIHELLKLATGKVEHTSSDTSLVLSTEAIISIQTYANSGASLPINLAQVKQFLGDYECDIAGLTNVELLASYIAIRDNGQLWNPIKADLLSTAADLDSFADTMNYKGDKILGFLSVMVEKYYTGDLDIDAISSEQLLDEDFVAEFMKNFNGDADAVGEDAAHLAMSAKLIQTLTKEATTYYDRSIKLLDKILSFQDGIESNYDDVKHKESTCDQLDLDQELEDLKVERREIKARIQTLKADYDYNVGLAFSGIVGGVIGIAITGGIFGAKAEVLRKQMNNKKAELDKKDKDIESLSRMLNAVTAIDGQLEGVTATILQAEKGANQLVKSWKIIVNLLEKSHTGCEAIVTSADLCDYWMAFDDVVHPWADVQGNAQIIVDQINKALDTIKIAQKEQDNLLQIQDSSLSIEPKVDILKLNKIAEQIRDNNNELVSSGDYLVYLDICRRISDDATTAKSDTETSILAVESKTNITDSSMSHLNNLILRKLKELETETDPEQIENINVTINSFRKKFINKLNPILNDINKYAEGHTDSVNNIMFFEFKNELTDEQKELESKITFVNETIDKRNSEIADTTKKIKELDKARELLRQYNVFDFFADAIPSLDQITDFVEIPVPELQAIAVKFDILSSLADEVGRGFSYDLMVDASQFLNDERDVLNAERAELKDKKRKYEHNLFTINIVIAIDKNRSPLCVELTNLADCYTNFVKSVNDLENEDRHFNRVLELFILMSSYMGELEAGVDSINSRLRTPITNSVHHFSSIKGMSEHGVIKLNNVNITSVTELLKAGGQPKGRKQIAHASGIDESTILNWLNRADLGRVTGIDAHYADLLEVSGVDTVPELAQRNAENLVKKLTEVNNEKNLVSHLPSKTTVSQWIQEASKLPKALHY
ncbi:hypothetical protein AKG98_4065 [Moritella sp. JT01]|uniref:alpha-xenorhabdolysin family binary toxin subunit A n=1 Tax=Moritella sp. JT01 TaxID=756698 RepID=UPI000793E650|nr:alpha-xenorhabdolysin family binary toxin subunit A [Moritella sp. JT01]KXO12869.1 hypothetical protein AKG98_4065 [Moritella sp. JT01]